MERIICHLSAEAFHWDPGWEDFSCVVTIWIGIRPRPGFGLDNTLMTASENWVACSPCDFCYPWKARQFSCPLENRVLPASFHILIERGPPFDGDRQIIWCACPAMHVAHWVGLYSKSFVLWSCRKLVLIHGEKWAVWGTFERKKKKKKVTQVLFLKPNCHLKCCYQFIKWKDHQHLFNGPGPRCGLCICGNWTSICWCQQTSPPFFIPTSLSLQGEMVFPDPLEADKAGL